MKERVRSQLARLPGNWFDVVRQVRFEARASLRHGAGCRKAARLPAPGKLNLGCGANGKAGWFNVDLFDPGADLHLDLRQPLPFRDESCDVVYSEHFFEHLDYPEPAQRHLADVFRILRPGGAVHIGVPDTGLILAQYSDEDFQWERPSAHPEWCATPLDSINYHFRQNGEHRYAYDEENLTRILSAAGFVEVGRRAFDSSIDSENRRIGTLYMSATKPRT